MTPIRNKRKGEMVMSTIIVFLKMKIYLFNQLIILKKGLEN